MGLKTFYEKKYKVLLIIPIILIVLSLVQIGYQISTTGDFVDKGVALKGGNTLRIETQYSDAIGLESYLGQEFPGEDFDVRISTARGVQDAIIIEATEGANLDLLLEKIKSKLGDQAPPIEDMASEVGTVSSSFSANFFRSALIAVLIAFVFMGIMVFYYFRVPIPSLAVILAAASDILVTLAVFNLLGMKLSTGGIAAFLMLIGYSVDTDILLSTRVLKQGTGTVFERTISSMKTGLTMTGTTIAAVTVALIFSKSEILQQIMIILLIGLLVDLIMTWFQNAVILRWYLERKGRE